MKTLLTLLTFVLTGLVCFFGFDMTPDGVFAMSTVAGAFTETQLKEIRIMAERMGMDSRIKTQYTPFYYDSLLAVLQNQSARIRQLETPMKDQTIEVSWMNFCEGVVKDSTNCIIDGTELSTNIETYALTLSKEFEFKVNESDFINNDYGVQDAIAKGYLRADAKLTEFVAQYLIAFIEASKGVNGFTGGKGSVVGNDTYIAPQYWDHTIMAYFARVAKWNQFASPFMLDGSNLIEQVQIADWERGNDNGKGKMSAFGSLLMYFDELTIDTVNADKRTYLIDRNAIAVANKADYPSTPIKYHDRDRFSIPSQFMPGWYFDVDYMTSCESASNWMTHQFKVSLRYGIYANPAGCNANNTGFLSFVCGVPSVQ